MLLSIVKDPVISSNDLNHNLDIICHWTHQWKMEFNPDTINQTTEVLFSCKKSSAHHPQLIFNGTVVAKVIEQKHLVFILDSGLSLENHLNEKIIKAKRNIGIIKHLLNFLRLKTLDQMYKALVRSHLDYCDIIYHAPSLQNQPPLGVTLNSIREKVETIQYQAALAVTGTWQCSNRSKLYEELGWERYLIVVGAGISYKFTRLAMIIPLLTSHLDYCDIIYHITPIVHPTLGISLNNLMENVERIQYLAVLAVTSAWQGSSL